MYDMLVIDKIGVKKTEKNVIYIKMLCRNILILIFYNPTEQINGTRWAILGVL